MGICHPMKNEKNCFTSHQISVGYSPPRKERSHLQIHSKMSLVWNPYGDLHVDSDFEKDQFVDLRNYYSSLWDYYNHDLCLEITILYIPRIVKENLFLTCIKLLKCTSWRYSLTSVFFWWLSRHSVKGPIRMVSLAGQPQSLSLGTEHGLVQSPLKTRQCHFV